MVLKKLTEIPESVVELNRARYRGELAQTVFQLMRKNGVKRHQLAELLGVTRGRISHILSGEKNLQAETFADVLLVLGAAAHVAIGSDPEKYSLPITVDPTDSASGGWKWESASVDLISFAITHDINMVEYDEIFEASAIGGARGTCTERTISGRTRINKLQRSARVAHSSI